MAGNIAPAFHAPTARPSAISYANFSPINLTIPQNGLSSKRLAGNISSMAMERRAMSRSHRDNQRRLDREAQRSYLDWYNAGRGTGEPARSPYRRIVRYGTPLRRYWAGVKVKRRRIERRRRERLDLEVPVQAS
jgi:hypothetical protein